MTNHYFETPFVKLHYYKFGSGARHMLCFHGLGMHGRQFEFLGRALGAKYTFWGFDLLFHKGTVLKDSSLPTIKKGMQKEQLRELISSFCTHQQIPRFSVVSYSMGTHYATTLVETIPELIDEYIVAAPSSIKPLMITRFVSRSAIGNKVFERLMLSENRATNMVALLRRLRFIDKPSVQILHNEVATAELRLAIYSTFTYLRFMLTKEAQLIRNLHLYNIRSIFVFGKADKMYPPKIGKKFFPKLQHAEVITLDDNHNMIGQNFATKLNELLG